MEEGHIYIHHNRQEQLSQSRPQMLETKLLVYVKTEVNGLADFY